MILLTAIQALPLELKDYASELYTKHKEMVWCIANRILHNQEWAKEVTQTVFLNLLGKLDLLVSLAENNRKAYIWVTAKYTSYSFYKKEIKQNHDDINEIEYKLDSEEESVVDTVVKNDEYLYVASKLNVLKADYKDIIEMRISLQMSYQEIGKLLGISEGNARVKFFRALNRLKKEIALGRREGL